MLELARDVVLKIEGEASVVLLLDSDLSLGHALPPLEVATADFVLLEPSLTRRLLLAGRLYERFVLIFVDL